MLSNEEVLGNFLGSVIEDMEKVHSGLKVDDTKGQQYNRFLAQLDVFCKAFGPMHMNDLKDYFAEVDIISENVHHLLTSHCSKIIKEFTNIFNVLMYCHSFAYVLLQFCRRNGLDYGEDISAFMRVTFFHSVKYRFFVEGGWIVLVEFCSAKKLLDILDFINVCYSEEGKLLTLVQFRYTKTDQDRWLSERLQHRGFGVHSKNTLVLLKANLSCLEHFVIESFKVELKMNPYYSPLITTSFLKMDSALEHAIQNFNSPEKTRIKRELLDFLNYLELLASELVQRTNSSPRSSNSSQRSSNSSQRSSNSSPRSSNSSSRKIYAE